VNLVANIYQITGMRQAPPRHVCDVQQTVESPQIDKCTVIGKILDGSCKDSMFFQMLKRLRSLFRLLFFKQLLA